MPQPKTLTALLQDLVAIPSVNPQGDPGTDRTGEQALAEYVRDFLGGLGAEVQLEEIEPGRPNLCAVFAPEKKETGHYAFAPHLDTVSVAGMTIPPFDPQVRDGKLYGRGASDTKGPMAAALWAVKSWAESPARSETSLRWTFLALMGEEAGNDGALALARQQFSADLVVVLEPTDLGVVTAHKGALWLEVVTTGLACHGATPEQGKNALFAMRRVLEHLENNLIPAWKKNRHPRLGHPTINPGTLHGGSKINIVPDRCVLELDCRVLPGTDPELLTRELGAELQKASPDVQVRLIRYSPPLDTAESLPAVEKLSRLARGCTTAPWFSDASVLSSPRCPAVCLGPGSIAQAHTRDEFIFLHDLEEGYNLFQRWMLSAV